MRYFSFEFFQVYHFFFYDCWDSLSMHRDSKYFIVLFLNDFWETFKNYPIWWFFYDSFMDFQDLILWFDSSWYSFDIFRDFWQLFLINETTVFNNCFSYSSTTVNIHPTCYQETYPRQVSTLFLTAGNNIQHKISTVKPIQFNSSYSNQSQLGCN